MQVNALDSLGQTALHRVAQQGNMQACRLLMSYAIDPSIVSHQGYTAAQLATDNIQKLLQGKSYVFLVCYHLVHYTHWGLCSISVYCEMRMMGVLLNLGVNIYE